MIFAVVVVAVVDGSCLCFGLNDESFFLDERGGALLLLVLHDVGEDSWRATAATGGGGRLSKLRSFSSTPKVSYSLTSLSSLCMGNIGKCRDFVLPSKEGMEMKK